MAVITLGYHGYNQTLRKDHILTDRTARLETVKRRGLRYLQGLFHQNVADLLKIIQWNIDNNVHLYRISSALAPHITNSELIRGRNVYTLAYKFPKRTKQILQQIGKLAKEHRMRLTFHPGIFVALNSPTASVITNSLRDIYYHFELFHAMRLWPYSDGAILVLHGGGVYGDKAAAMERWIDTYAHIPGMIRQFIVLEND